MTNEAKAQVLEAGLQKLQEAAQVLQGLYEDPEIRGCIAELEGMGFGWFRDALGGDRLLADVLLDQLLTARRPA